MLIPSETGLSKVPRTESPSTQKQQGSELPWRISLQLVSNTHHSVMTKGETLLKQEAERLASLSEEELERDWLIYQGKQHELTLQINQIHAYWMAKTTAYRDAMEEINRQLQQWHEQNEELMKERERLWEMDDEEYFETLRQKGIDHQIEWARNFEKEHGLKPPFAEDDLFE